MTNLMYVAQGSENDFNIVIAHRGNPIGLWATIHSCEIDLLDTDYKYTYIIVMNGEELLPEVTTNLKFLERAGRIGYQYTTPEAMAPPVARQHGTQRADGKYLFFLDNHCLVVPGYFKRALASMQQYNMDMLHSATRFVTGENTHYEYRLILEQNFWGDSRFTPMKQQDPYQIAAGGHGGFVVRRDVWEEVGGYWDGFVGYAGEEMYLDLKMALLGKTNWIDPKLIHYHYCGNRGYARHYTDDYYINLMAVANIIGGPGWLERVYTSFNKCAFRKYSPQTIFDLMMIAEERSRPHAEWLEGKRLRTLDEQLQYFKDNNISH
jgi:hypothetical protein